MTTERMTRKAARIIAKNIVDYLHGALAPYNQEEIPSVGDLAELLYTDRRRVYDTLDEMWTEALTIWDNEAADALTELMVQVNHPSDAVWAREYEKEMKA